MRRSTKRRMLQVLSPYGNWSHPRGMQVVDRKSAENMRKAFGGAISKLCGKRLPIYIGHPDDKMSAKNKLPKPVGFILQILPTEGGIAVETEYPETTYSEIISGKYEGLSARWEMSQIDEDTYTPIRLISAGLTNTPNIPGSGKILSADTHGGKACNLTESLARAKQSSQSCRSVLLSARRCLAKARENSASIKEAGIRARMQMRASKCCAHSKETITPAELSQMALERSRALAEPYSRSFAILRRESNCN